MTSRKSRIDIDRWAVNEQKERISDSGPSVWTFLPSVWTMDLVCGLFGLWTCGHTAKDPAVGLRLKSKSWHGRELGNRISSGRVFLSLLMTSKNMISSFDLPARGLLSIFLYPYFLNIASFKKLYVSAPASRPCICSSDLPSEKWTVFFHFIFMTLITWPALCERLSINFELDSVRNTIAFQIFERDKILL